MQILHSHGLSPNSKKPPNPEAFPLNSFESLNYFAAAFSPGFAYFRRNRSTRPAVSTSLCLPVKNGWQLEQISTKMSPLCVERVVKLLPQAQCTFIGSYVG